MFKTNIKRNCYIPLVICVFVCDLFYVVFIIIIFLLKKKVDRVTNVAFLLGHDHSSILSAFR